MSFNVLVLLAECCAESSAGEARAHDDFCASYIWPSSSSSADQLLSVRETVTRDWNLLHSRHLYRYMYSSLRTASTLMCDMHSLRTLCLDETLLAKGFPQHVASRYTLAISPKHKNYHQTVNLLRNWLSQYSSMRIATAESDAIACNTSAFKALVNTMRLKFCLKPSKHGVVHLQTLIKNVSDVVRTVQFRIIC